MTARNDDYRTLGRTGIRVSPLALGAMTFDDGTAGSAPAESFGILDRYLESGGNFIDTANQYNGGASEETLGSYFAERTGVRDRIVLSTKFGCTMHPDDPNGGGAGRKAIHTQLRDSLRRLKTDYIDVYWMHHYDPHTPLEETISTLNDLVRAGSIRSYGLSNVPAWWVAKAATTAHFRGWEGIAGLQLQYSLLTREAEAELFGVARDFGIGVTPWSPLASGMLSGKYSRSGTRSDGSIRASYVNTQLSEEIYALLDVLERMASDRGASVAQVALTWVRQQPEVTSTLVGARTRAQLDDNLASTAVTLTAEEMCELSTMTKPPLGYPHEFLASFVVGYQQGNTTINGRASQAMSQSYAG